MESHLFPTIYAFYQSTLPNPSKFSTKFSNLPPIHHQKKKKRKSIKKTQINTKTPKFKLKSSLLGEIPELTQDADEPGHGDALEDGLGVILLRRAVEIRIR